ncbi:hypothetical protein QNH28_24305 [Paenibacillus sp. G2S3]|uniref:hypothetical protein n=1 Tax=Paenibacillus sp. G2S3 TaxID=3047872 RepID=UPI0024C10A7F|nr:hypothetical protein [Paenibacillus sp. G2S3]WHY18555.1 hypothetical protein QNH28_24305 [Paenibacillus sp. G2S3]
MKINNNYLKEQLKHLYWLNGGPCAGKTTMTKKFVEEHCQWLFQVVEEMMDFFIINLLKLPDDKPIIIDLGIMPEFILLFIPEERMICFYTSDAEIERLYYFREDHKMILDCINAYTLYPEETIKHSNKSMIKFSNEIKNACTKLGIKTIERTPNMSVEEQFRLVREHFKILG